MTPEAQRIAIAKACGWKMITTKDCGPYPHGVDPNGDRMHTAILPDYLADLNAMHEAEKVLTREQLTHYACVKLKGNISAVVHATAAQRAEAFLRTLNLWDDTK